MRPLLTINPEAYRPDPPRIFKGPFTDGDRATDKHICNVCKGHMTSQFCNQHPWQTHTHIYCLSCQAHFYGPLPGAAHGGILQKARWFTKAEWDETFREENTQREKDDAKRILRNPSYP